MKRVLFHTNTINYRGTTVAVTDYARYNQEILGNESIIAYNHALGYEKDMGSEQDVLDELEKEFRVIGYENDIQLAVDGNKIDFAYFIRAGHKEPLPKYCETGVHAVFQYNDYHGDRYAYISEWLSNHMTEGQAPFVPHIVNLPAPTGSYRKALGISEDKVVIGRIGGYYTFDIDWVKSIVSQFADTYVFLFVGTEPFVDHPNVKFINEIHSPQKKANFMNTCDAMLHARTRGESFGLSICEFLSFNKPVLAWNGGLDLNHIEMLKGTDGLYNTPTDLREKLTYIKDLKGNWSDLVVQFKPGPVMKKFKEVFYD